MRLPGIGSIAAYTRQPDAMTCQSACCAQMIGLSSEEDVKKVRAELLGIASKNGSSAGDPSVMAEFLKPRVDEYRLDLSASLEEAREALDDGYKLITHGYFTGSGHVISIVGWEPNPENLNRRFLVDDPWCEFDFPSWKYNYSKSGNDVRYSFHGIYAACVAGQSTPDASRIYKRGELDSKKGGMWLHLIRQN